MIMKLKEVEAMVKTDDELMNERIIEDYKRNAKEIKEAVADKAEEVMHEVSIANTNKQIQLLMTQLINTQQKLIEAYAMVINGLSGSKQKEEPNG